MADPASKNAGILSSVFAIIAFLILIVIVIWGLVHLAGLTGDWFGRFFGGSPSGTIVVTAPKETVSGEPFAVSWRYDGNTKGTYALLYQCKNDLTLKAAPRIDLQAVSVPCGAAYTIGNGTSISLTAFTKNASTTLPLTIIFLPASTSTARAQGSANIIVQAATQPTTQSTSVANTTQTNTNTPATSQRPAAQPVAPSESDTSAETQAPAATPAKLSVRILAVNVIDPSTGAIVNRAPSSPNDTVAVEFDIANHGGSESGSYTFEAQLPTTGSGYYYQSTLQSPLGPGDHVVNILRFTQMDPQGGTFSVRIMPSSQHDSSATLDASQYIDYAGGGYYNYQQSSYQYQNGY